MLVSLRTFKYAFDANVMLSHDFDFQQLIQI